MNYSKGSANAAYGKMLNTIIELTQRAEKAEEVRRSLVTFYARAFKDLSEANNIIDYHFYRGELCAISYLLSSAYGFKILTLLDVIERMDSKYRERRNGRNGN